MTDMRFLKGDATSPQAKGRKVIAHVCNDLGKWGKGFVLAISRRWKEPERVCKASFDHSPPPALGDVQFVPVAASIVVANLIGQHGIATRASKTPPVRYDAIRDGLVTVAASDGDGRVREVSLTRRGRAERGELLPHPDDLPVLENSPAPAQLGPIDGEAQEA